MSMEGEFGGRVVLVAGAARGIGFACAEAFAACGATVALADIAQEGLHDAADKLRGGATGDNSTHRVDLGDATAGSELVTDVIAAHGRIDVLVNAAGLMMARPFLELEPAEWDRVNAVNARGAVFLAQAAARQMVARASGGRIVLFASLVARRPVRLNNVAYSASKAAILQAATCMALELAPHQITVNVVSPGSTATEMLLEDQLGGGVDARERALQGDPATWRLGIPLGRLAEPADQAAAVLFLAGDGARHITGQELIVDGGQAAV
jgi:NAD(P)-dependent dehydrogenase (short-subunit alcohol dehydrogenase family)